MSAGRTFHTDSRTWSNFQAAELVKLCGVPQGRWPEYVVKELLDNAVAALEEFKVSRPTVRVSISADSVSVGDNGPGISNEVLDFILDFDKFGGSNRHHKLPTRGAQGNAFMTIIGIVSTWKGYMELRRPTQNAVSLEVRLDSVRQHAAVERVDIDEEPSGSSITVPWPALPTKRGGSTMEDVVEIVKKFVYLNPHVTFFLNLNGARSARPSLPDATSIMRSTPDCGAVTWFSEDEFAARLAADTRARPHLGTIQWMSEFAFLSGKLAVPDGCAKTLREFERYDERALSSTASRLKTIITDATTRGSVRRGSADEPRFSPVGETSLKDMLVNVHGVDDNTVQYKMIEGQSSSGVPFLVEVCLAQMPEGSTSSAPDPIIGLNRTPLYGSPTFKGVEWREKVRGPWHSFNGDLAGLCRAYQIDHGKTPCAVVVHAISPSPGYAGYGKQQFDTSWLSAPLSEAMERVTLEVRKQRAGESRRSKSNAVPTDNIRETMFKLLPGLWDEATENGKIPVLIRQMFYATRKVWHLHHDKDLQYGTFCAYVDEYEQKVGRLLCYRDPRGTLIEPHSGRSVRLGTDEMAKFNPKKWEGHTIIFVEKEGFAHLLKAYNVTRRYDAIVIGSKGFAVEACREALQKYRKLLGDMVKIIALHDADPAGYGIGYDLATNLPRFGESVDVKVLDVGLTMEDARSMGLQDEPFDLKKQTWSMVKRMRREIVKTPSGARKPLLDDAAWDAFMPSMYRFEDYPEWADNPKGRRVELNAMAPRQFITWLENILDDNDCKKVRPPDTIVDEKLKEARENFVRNEVGSYLMRMIGDDAVMAIIRHLAPPSIDLDGILAGKPEQHWEYITTRAAQTGVDLTTVMDEVIGKRLSTVSR